MVRGDDKMDNKISNAARKLVPVTEAELEMAYGTGCTCSGNGSKDHYNHSCCMHDCWIPGTNKGSKSYTDAS